MRALPTLVSLLRKDFRIELRTQAVVLPSALFSLLLVVTAAMAFEVESTEGSALAAGVFWLVVVFGALRVVERSWDRERDHGMLAALRMAPMPPWVLLVSKVLATSCYLLVIQVVALGFIALFFADGLLREPLGLLAFIVLADIGFLVPANLFAALTSRQSGAVQWNALLVFPLVLPAVLAAAAGTRALIAGPEVAAADPASYLRVLGMFTLVVATVSVVLFDAMFHDFDGI